MSRLAAGAGLEEALQDVATAAALAADADVAIVWVPDQQASDGGALIARTVAGASALASQLESSRAPGRLPDGEATGLAAVPGAVRAAAERAGVRTALVVPVRVGKRLAASLDLLRAGEDFDETQREAARLAAAQLAVLLAVGSDGGAKASAGALELVGQALAVADEQRAAQRIVRLAVEATGAAGCALWRVGEPRARGLLAAIGEADPVELGRLPAASLEARELPTPQPAGAMVALTFALGQPPAGSLQLVYQPDSAPGPDAVERLAVFAGAAARALRAGERHRATRREFERTRDLLSVVGQATAELSLAHTLETAVDRVSALLDVGAVALYLRRGVSLEPAAALEVTGPHVTVAERLLELALGPFRARGAVVSGDPARDRRLASVRGAVEKARIEGVHAVPLVAHGDVIGLLAAYPKRGRALTSDQSALLHALAGQLAVAVENARLHEETKQLGADRERALELQRLATRRLSALYEISRSFAQSLSLERTIDAVGRTLIELLAVDAVVISLPDERGEALVAEAVHVADPRLEPAMRAVFAAPGPIADLGLRRRLARGLPITLDLDSARASGHAHAPLVPFLEGGSTAAVVPVTSSAELLATLTVVSLDPGRPITQETIDDALSVAAQVALAVDNARLYQQQKQFTDAMQRSLLPRTRPRMAGLDVGWEYESSALLGVGGDLYDYVQVGEGRLAVVLGDVTGHGAGAAADMAMAKFVFRSLARNHPEPAAFLAAANEVVVEEVGSGKFISMLYLVIDLGRGDVACGSAGHPAPRLIDPWGGIEPLPVEGIVLGIERGQSYTELRRPFVPGAAVVLYTDGVVEARRDGELYGEERLDRILAAHHDLPVGQLAGVILDDCRRFAGGEVRDDCAIVVVRRR